MSDERNLIVGHSPLITLYSSLIFLFPTEESPMPTALVEKGEKIFEFEPHADTIVMVPVVNLGESDCERIEEAAKDIFEFLDRSAYRNIVLDFYKTDFYGSMALAFFVKLWKWARNRNGRLIFCNLSGHEKEILEVAHLDQLWPICDTKSEALRTVQE
jgi:anti-anti-sigma factor